MIYFVMDSLTYRIKIGFTGKDDVKARLAELQTGSSSLLYLLATREGTKQTETDLHEQFAKLRTQGEWFQPGPELIQYIIGCSAVLMARQAVGEAAAALVKASFPETKAEKARRFKAEHDRLITETQGYLDELRGKGVSFHLGILDRNPFVTYRVPMASPELRASLGHEAEQLLSHRMDELIEILQSEERRRKASQAPSRFKPGMEVEHERYGRGIVLDASGEADLRKVMVQFAAGGNRTFLESKTELRIIPQEGGSK